MIRYVLILAKFVGSAVACGALVACVNAPMEDEDENVEEEDSAIVGGQEDSKNPALRMAVAMIKYDVVQNGSVVDTYTCSGTLVGAKVVLTAAHCVAAELPENTYQNHRVFFGVTPDLNKGFKVVKTNVSPKYDRFKPALGNDVAVLELERAPAVFPLRVAGAFGDLTGRKVTDVGYGQTRHVFDRSTEGTRRFASYKITKQTADHLVAGNNKRVTCQGDSGGPRLLEHGGRFYVVGVNSFGGGNLFQQCINSFKGWAARTDRSADFLRPYLGSALVDITS